MDARIWQAAKVILADVCELPPAEQRAYIEQHCSDPAMRAELLALIESPAALSNVLAGALTLAAGTRLGPYEIVSRIGAGGMGEVYRARDTRLSRDVAIKILPLAVAADRDRRARFEREARTISSLNHPHICTVHDVGEQDGIGYLVMELVEGETLADRLARGALPMDKALTCGIQIAEGLAAAHRVGIIHRDLKPANIMLTKTGAKLLDFGLAMWRPSSTSVDTVSTRGGSTAQGAIVGTLPYMAPEQLEGRETDERTDIFAFGAVLYEMLTGRRAFAGDSTAALISAILREEPASLTADSRRVSASLERVVGTCLEKTPDDRWQNAADLARVLRSIAESPENAADRRSFNHERVLWTCAAVLALALGGVTMLRPHPRPPAMTGVANRIQLVVPLPESVKSIQGVSVSPDNMRLAFVGGDQLWTYELATRTVKPVVGVGGSPPQFPFWSPDGRLIAYFQSGKLMKISADGGIPTKICDLDRWPPRGGTWSGDTVLFAEAKDVLLRVSAAGGMPVRLTHLADQEGAHYWPQFLPDGRHFTYMTWEATNKVYIASLDSAEPRRLVAPERGVVTDSSRAFAVSGFLLTAESGTLRARLLRSSGTEPEGEPQPLARDVANSGNAGDSFFSASPSVLAYVVAKSRPVQFSIVDRDGRQITTVDSPLLMNSRQNGRDMWSLSPDARTLAFTQLADDQSSDIHLLDLGGGAAKRFTFGPGDSLLPVWSPSSDRIVFTRDGVPEGPHLRSKSVGSETDSPLASVKLAFEIPHDWHGNVLLFAALTDTGAQNLWQVATDGSRAPQVWLPSKFGFARAQFSPDGRWVAYVSNETGDPEVHVRRFPEADHDVLISKAGGNRPRWRSDGRALFYVEGNKLVEVELEIGDTVRTLADRNLFPLGDHCGYAVLPSTKGFLLCRSIDPQSAELVVVINWAASLRSQ